MGSLSRHMGRYVSWLANAGLLVLCCFLVANTTNAVLAAWLDAAPEHAEFAVSVPPAVDRSWEARERILDRNLFHAMLAPPPPPPAPVAEEIEATKLPLTLIGTVASANPALALAALNDTQSREHLVVAIGDSIQGKATVKQIEARRILLTENGKTRELVLDEQGPNRVSVKANQKKRARKARASRKAAARRAKQRAARKTPPKPSPAPAAPKANPVSVFMSEVQIAPNYIDGAMDGFQVSSVQPGGIIAGLGIQSGDVITELNGVALTSPEDSFRVLGESSPDGFLNVKVRGENGEQVLAIPMPNKE